VRVWVEKTVLAFWARRKFSALGAGRPFTCHQLSLAIMPRWESSSTIPKSRPCKRFNAVMPFLPRGWFGTTARPNPLDRRSRQGVQTSHLGQYRRHGSASRPGPKRKENPASLPGRSRAGISHAAHCCGIHYDN
jgi:hypothetical protein